MKFNIEKKLLERAMMHAVGITDRKQSIPILGYVLLSASATDNSIVVTSTNMDMTVIDTLKCNRVEESGAYCLPGVLLYEITKKMKGNSTLDIAFNKTDNSISISSGKTNFSIHYMDKDNFPPIVDASYTVQFSLRSNILKNAFDVSRVAMLQDNTRFHLNGIHMHYENDMGMNKLRFVATDLFRISCGSIIAPSEVQNMPPIIISKKAVNEALRLVDDSAAEEVRLSVSDTRVSFRLSDKDMNTEFSSRLINGTFPEYKSALDVSNDKILLVENKDLISAIDRVSTVVMDSTNSIKLSISSDKLVLTGVSRELGTAIEEVDVSFNAFEPMEICFNSKYLIEILNKIETAQVKFLLAESSSSTIILPSESGNELDMQFAIMPIEIVKS